MSKVAVVFWSGTGNTEAMANKVADGAKAAGAEVACGEGIITQETPDDDALAKCKELGKTLAAV